MIKVTDEDLLYRLDNIGTLNEKMRESIFEYWHVSRENCRISAKQYIMLLEHGMQMIFEQIDKPQNDMVYTRSYSLLLIDCVLQADIEHQILNDIQYQQLVAALIKYQTTEQDWRGYDDQHGYIHTLAHLSDCVYSIGDNPWVSSELQAELLLSFLAVLPTVNCRFEDQEQMRVIRAISSYVPSHLQIIQQWLSTVNNQLAANQELINMIQAEFE